MLNTEPSKLRLPCSEHEFIQRYWQRQPCFIRQGLPGFESLLDSAALFQLAARTEVASNLIQAQGGAKPWDLRYGAFPADTWANLPDSHWTMLIRAVEQHHPELRSLLQTFDFIPNWRTDNLMLSYAVPYGSVGPHIDRYDVFLLQAQGCRRWHISHQKDITLLPETEHWVMKNFQAEQTWITEPGDILYLPPGVAHHGIAIDDCITYSIGHRPQHLDLSTEAHIDFNQADWFGCHMSLRAPLPKPLPQTFTVWKKQWQMRPLERKCDAFYANDSQYGVRVFIQGERYPLPSHCLQQLDRLCRAESLNADPCLNTFDLDLLQALYTWTQQGYWQFSVRS